MNAGGGICENKGCLLGVGAVKKKVEGESKNNVLCIYYILMQNKIK